MSSSTNTTPSIEITAKELLYYLHDQQFYNHSATNSQYVGGAWPSRIGRWEEFLNDANQHKFSEVKMSYEEELKFYRTYNSIFDVLKYYFGSKSYQRSYGPFCDHNYNYTFRLIKNEKKILAIKFESNDVLENLVNADLQSLNCPGTLHNVIKKFYNYMVSSQLQYGVLSSDDCQWFMYRPKNNHTELYISHPLRFESISLVFKSCAYLAHIAERDPTSPYHNIAINNNISFDFSDFEFGRLLGYGQTGGTFKCKFHGQTIALKVLNLYNNGQFLDRVRKEIDIYKYLAKIQGVYIPKLVCYGYYGSKMGYVMGTTIVGTELRHHKIEKWQKDKALEALDAIHNYNILHCDIREENILVNKKGDIYFIDFEMSIVNYRYQQLLFNQERSELSKLLDNFM